MDGKGPKPETIDDYIAGFPPEVQTILTRIRETVRRAAPEATETISYQIPAFKRDGVVVFFAAFKHHIGLYPPVTGDPDLMREVAPYAGAKGNLKFPLDRPIPYDLIGRIASQRVKHNAEQAVATRTHPGS